MAHKKVLVLNPLTGELQQLQAGDSVFGLVNGDNVPSMISAAVAAEATLRTAADRVLTDAIAAEQSARVAADLAEVTARDAAIATAVSAANSTLQAAIDAEVTNRQAADAAEVTARDAAIAAAVAAEATARAAADSTLTTNLANEVAARTAADSTLQANIDAEATARAAADLAEVSARDAAILVETTNRQDADALLQAAIESEATSRAAADATLTTDLATEVTARTAADLALQANIDTKVSKAGDTMTGPLLLSGAPTVAAHAATKGYVDSLAGGLSWQEPVVGIGAALPGTAAIGHRFVNTADGKIYTATAIDTWNAGVAPADGYAVFDKSSETGYVYSGTAWVQFTGTGQVVAGLGLMKTGNRLDVEVAGALTFAPAEGSDLETHSKVTLVTSGEFDQTSGTLSLVDASIANSKLTNSKITINGSDVALGGSFTIAGAGAISVATVGSTSTVSVATATDAVKGVATFNTGSFTVTAGDVALADVGTAGTYGSSTAIPVITTDAKGRVTTVTTAAINTAASTYDVATTGLSVGDAVYMTNAGTLAKAQADVAGTVKVIGFVYQAGKIATSGVIGGLTGLTVGDRYFLSAGTAGVITNAAPSTDGQFVVPVGVAVSATELAINLGTPVRL